ncbi:MAG: phosphoribosylformylglycinamidine synthase [Holophaga sp.]|nr:phosphoribosylformylglycinamidine synthase [Holophaga sp.]
MSHIRRIFVEKKSEFAVEARHILHDLRENLGLKALESLRLVIRYDVEGLGEPEMDTARWTVFAEPPLDEVHEETLPLEAQETAFAVEYLPGQYDQRADSAAQCLQLLSHGARPTVACARVYVLKGAVAAEDVARAKAYLVNPVDSRLAASTKPVTLNPALPAPADVPVLAGFTTADEAGLLAIQAEHGMAMTLADLQHTQAYFRDEERRDPSETELRMLDTYWSDHCRHTTFLTELTKVSVEPSPFTATAATTYADYQKLRQEVFGARLKEKPECLMDIALLPARALRKAGKLDDQEVTSEINACSVIVDIDVIPTGKEAGAGAGGHGAQHHPEGAAQDVRREEWLLMFKNETHNHPTEIEPFGGAATCLGGAIRDPLSGRAYVYQSMRVTGSGDPTVPVADTIPGKLPQRKITTEAANGFSSYGNQIGLCTGQVVEVYDPGYVAKRMEIGAVVGAVPRAQVRREEPVTGDVIILVGGRTGRDGVGGATGSSKSHTEDSIDTCGAEVQKGDAPMERKLQRLFRKAEFSQLVKKCNDFGAGGVSVAIGELAEGLKINLDVVPKKYDGLNGTELAIAESQERMAVVVAPADAAEVIRLANAENLEANLVAEVTAEPRLRMTWRGQTIVDLSRAFIDSNGAAQFTQARVTAPVPAGNPLRTSSVAESEIRDRWLKQLADLNTCSQRGLTEKFDCTIGAGTVLLPYGGRTRRTPSEAMVAKFPVQGGSTTSASAMSHGFFPAISRWSPFHGAVWAHVQAAAKLVAVGGDHHKLRFTLQEYFGKPMGDADRWGQPLAALLGALHAEMAMETPAIGGKDSMSGTFKDLDVPPTLVAFAVDVVQAEQVISPEFKGFKHSVVLVELPRTAEELPEWEKLHATYERISNLVKAGRVKAAKVVGMDGLAAALSIMAFGNEVGLALTRKDPAFWFTPRPGAFVLELDTDPAHCLEGLAWTALGTTLEETAIHVGGQRLALAELQAAWENRLEHVFPTRLDDAEPAATLPPFAPFDATERRAPAIKVAKPRVVITAFPGSNCEYDLEARFREAGAEVETVVFRNLDPKAVEESLDAMATAIQRSQIVMIPGGFSSGDEPEGSGKFIAAAYRAPRVKDAVHELLKQRDGLVCGICNGFQALIKLGLVPYGEIREQHPEDPTLTFNSLRYMSRVATTRVTSNRSPWLSLVKPGDTHTVAIAHGEGRIVGPDALLRQLLASGQVATQYVDPTGQPTLDIEYNPNGSALAIEGLTSPDGRVFGKMAHPERYTPHNWCNAPGDKDQHIFEAGVAYFR